MFKKLCLLTTSLVLVSGTVWAEEPAPYNCDFSPSCEVAPGIYGAMGSPVTSKFKMSIGGYIKLDYVHNTNPVGFLAPGAPGGNLTSNSKKEESLFTAKQSRFWLKVAGPTFLGAKTNALVEMDFYGTGQLSNEFGNARMRHAYGSIDWTNTQVLFGQFWDTFGPAAADTIDFRQGGTTGAPSNPRVPQIRLTQKVNFTPNESLKLVVAAQNPTQDNAVPGDTSMSRYAGASGAMVNVAGQAIFSSKLLGVSPGMMGLGMAPLQFGAFGLYGNMKVAGQTTAIDNYGYGLYTFVPVLKSKDGKSRAMTASLEGQIYKATGLDVQGATNGGTSVSSAIQNGGLLGPVGNLYGARAIGYYGQAKVYATQDFAVTAGAMARVADKNEQYGANFERRNQMFYANLTYDLNAAVRVATEYSHQETRYGHLSAGAVDYAQNNSVKLAAYYFF